MSRHGLSIEIVGVVYFERNLDHVLNGSKYFPAKFHSSEKHSAGKVSASILGILSTTARLMEWEKKVLS